MKREQTEFELMVCQLEKFRNIGETFNYLGVTCIVTGHVEFNGFELCPRLLADYVDKNGVIRQVSFGYGELIGLKQQQEELKAK